MVRGRRGDVVYAICDPKTVRPLFGLFDFSLIFSIFAARVFWHVVPGVSLLRTFVILVYIASVCLSIVLYAFVY